MHLDELRVRSSGKLGVIRAADDIVMRRHRKRVELSNVSPGFYALEVISAAIIGNRITAVLEIDPNIGDALVFRV